MALVKIFQTGEKMSFETASEQFGSGGYLPPPHHSTFGGCGLPHCQIAEQQKTYDNGSKKLPDPSNNSTDTFS
jgi:hypothetical protein